MDLTRRSLIVGAIFMPLFIGSRRVLSARRGAAGSYLPAIAGSTPFVVAAKRVVLGYNGPLFQLTRVSDAATLDVSPVAGDLPDYSAIDTWVGASSAWYSRWYDQGGSGTFASQSATANGPRYTRLFPSGGAAGLSFDISQPTDVYKSLALPASLALSSQALSSFTVANPRSSINTNNFWGLNNAAGTAGLISFGQDAAQVGPGIFNTANKTANLYARAMPSLFSTTSSNTTTKVTVRETTVSSALTPTAATTAGGDIGVNFARNRASRGDIYAVAFYPTALSDVDAAAVRAVLTAAFDIPTNFSSRLVIRGDSITETSGALYGNGYWKQAGIKPDVEVFAFGISGDTAASANTNYATREGTVITNTVPTVAAVFMGTNDIFVSAATGAATYTALTSWLGKAVASGASSTIIMDVLPRNLFAGSTQAERTNLNTAIVGNAAGFNYVVDVAADARLSPSNNTTIYPDGTHPAATAAGYVGEDFKAPLVTLGLAA